MKSKTLNLFLSILLINLTVIIIRGQGIVNDGAKIIVKANTNLHLGIGGNYLNKTNGSNDGSITVDGDLFLKGNWVNNATGGDLLSGSNGIVELVGSGTQSITDGSRITHFPDLTIGSGVISNILINTTLKVDGDLVVNGALTLKSTTSGNGSLLTSGTISGTGTTKVERYLTNGDFHYISSPISNANISLLDDALDIYYYDETDVSANYLNGWKTPSGSMTVCQGYAVYYSVSDELLEFQGPLNNGTKSITISNTSTGGTLPTTHEGWNLIGNPYPSGISADAIIAANNSSTGTINKSILGTLYFWDEGGWPYNTSDYASWNGSGSIGGGGQTPNGYISSGQGFMVKNTGTDHTVTFTNSMRSSTNNLFFGPEDIIQRFKLAVISPNNLYNEILLAFLDDATFEFDNLYDAPKLRGNSDIALYAISEDCEYAILGYPTLNENKPLSIKVGLFAGTKGVYTFEFKNVENILDEVPIYLEDTKLNRMSNLSDLKKYEFFTNSGEVRNRFIIHINPSNIDIENRENMKIFSFDNNIYIELSDIDFGRGLLTIYDLFGREMHSQRIKGMGLTVIDKNFVNGCYIVELVLDDESLRKKIVMP